MDYFEACNEAQARKFKVGDKVKIAGPMYGGIDRLRGKRGVIKAIDIVHGDVLVLTGYDVLAEGEKFSFSFPASSLTIVNETPMLPEGLSQRQLLGDRAQEQGEWLPTRYIHAERTKDSLGRYDCGFVREKNDSDLRMGRHTHLIHDMPADENGVQVDFVTLTEAGYAVQESCGGYSWRASRIPWHYIKKPCTAIDAWRAAAAHYLANKPK